MAESSTESKRKNNLRSKAWYELNKHYIKDARILYGRDYRKKLKDIALSHYGRTCYCCGESISILLTIDHKFNNGSEQRKLLFGGNGRAGYNFYLWLQRNNWPDGLQTACFNCNQGRYLNGGICPHKHV